jgi:hypothetical protein
MLSLITEELSSVVQSSIERNTTPRETKVMSKVLELSTQYPKGLALAGEGENFLLVSPNCSPIEEKAVLATETGIYIIKQQRLEAGSSNSDRMVNVIGGAIDDAKQFVAKIEPDDFETKTPDPSNGFFIESITQVDIDDPDSATHQEMVQLIQDMSRFRASVDASRGDHKSNERGLAMSPVEALAKSLVESRYKDKDTAVNNYAWVASTDRRHPGIFETYGDNNRMLTNAIKTIDVDDNGNRLWIVDGDIAIVNYPGEVSKAGDYGLNLGQAIYNARLSGDGHYEADMGGRKMVVDICKLEQPDQKPEKLIQSLIDQRGE